jgi:hypothetical protein
MLYKLKMDQGLATFVGLHETTLALEGYVEKVMEGWLAANPHAVLPDGGKMLVINQETPFDNLTDILAVDEQGNVAVIEVKRGSAPRDVIAQTLEYASDVATWDYQRLNALALAYFTQRDVPFESLLAEHASYFGPAAKEMDETQFNQRQRLIVVSESVEPKIERAARWLQTFGVSISCIAYTCYREDGGDLFLDFESTVTEPSVVSSKPSVSDWTEESFMATLAAHEQDGAEAVAVCYELLRWCNTHAAIRWSSQTVIGRMRVVCITPAYEEMLFTVSTDARIQLNFGYLMLHAPFDDESLRLKLVDLLNTEVGLTLPPGCHDKYPRFPVRNLDDQGVRERFLSIFEWVINQIRGVTA